MMTRRRYNEPERNPEDRPWSQRYATSEGLLLARNNGFSGVANLRASRSITIGEQPMRRLRGYVSVNYT